MLGSRRRIYHGEWGSALFQSVYEPASHALWSLPLMPEWYLFTVVLGLISVFGLAWKSLFLFSPLFVLAAVMPLVQALRSATHATFATAPRTLIEKLALRGLTAALHMIQPLARLRGRLRHGLTPWRRFSQWRLAAPWPRTFTIWSERWQSHDERLKSVESAVREHGALVVRGGHFDHWDLEVRAGVLTGMRVRMAVEEHGSGKQFLRFRMWPRLSAPWIIAAATFAALSLLATVDRAWLVSVAFVMPGLLIAGRMCLGCATATAVILQVLSEARAREASASMITVEPTVSQRLIGGNGKYTQRYPARKVNYVAREAHANSAAKPSPARESKSEQMKAREASA